MSDPNEMPYAKIKQVTKDDHPSLHIPSYFSSICKFIWYFDIMHISTFIIIPGDINEICFHCIILFPANTNRIFQGAFRLLPTFGASPFQLRLASRSFVAWRRCRVRGRFQELVDWLLHGLCRYSGGTGTKGW